jgi:hypothetical protein
VDVTAVVGTSFTITRSVDGTSAFSHSNGATVTHADIGRDFRESRSHIDAAASPDAVGHAVHGINNGSSVVGTTDTQTLSNKSLTSAIFTGSTSMGSGTWTGSGSVQEATLGFSGITGATTGSTRLAGQTAAGPPTTGTFLTGDLVYDALSNLWFCTAGGSPGTWTAVGGRALLSKQSGVSANYSYTLPLASIPNRLEVFWRGASTAAVHNQILKLQFNSDSGANYHFERLEANNTTVASTGASAQTAIQIATFGGSSNTANYRGSGHFIVEGVTQTSVFPVVLGAATMFDTSANFFSGQYSGQYNATGGITSIQLTPTSGNWDANSGVEIYAIY